MCQCQGHITRSGRRWPSVWCCRLRSLSFRHIGWIRWWRHLMWASKGSLYRREFGTFLLKWPEFRKVARSVKCCRSAGKLAGLVKSSLVCRWVEAAYFWDLHNIQRYYMRSHPRKKDLELAEMFLWIEWNRVLLEARQSFLVEWAKEMRSSAH